MYFVHVKKSTNEVGEWSVYHSGEDIYNTEVYFDCERWYNTDGTSFNMKPNDAIDYDSDVLNIEDAEEFWGEMDREEDSGPSGIEGCERIQWYNKYIFVAWPKEHHFLHLTLEGSVPYLKTHVLLCPSLTETEPS